VKIFVWRVAAVKFQGFFLRRDLINLWNGLVDDENTNELNVLSAARGLGKSIYLYLIAVFARHFGIPVQYIGNMGNLLGQEAKGDLVARNYVGNTGTMLRKKIGLQIACS